MLTNVHILQVLLFWFRDSRFEPLKRVAAISDKSNRFGFDWWLDNKMMCNGLLFFITCNCLKGTLSPDLGHFGVFLWKDCAFFLYSLNILSFSIQASIPIFSMAWRARKLVSGYSPWERRITIIIRFWDNDLLARLLFMYFW